MFGAPNPSRPATSCLALGEKPRSWSDLLAAATSMAETLGSPRTVLLASRDRYYTLVTLLAAWARGGRVVFPSNLRPDTVEAIAAAEGASFVFSDDGQIEGVSAKRARSRFALGP